MRAERAAGAARCAAPPPTREISRSAQGACTAQSAGASHARAVVTRRLDAERRAARRPDAECRGDPGDELIP